MKHVVVIIDGAAGLPLPERGGRTSLEAAATPNLDALAGSGRLGLARTVPPGMEPGSACACMSVLGYDPTVYYRGRSPIEAHSMGVPVNEGEVTFRCNLVTVANGKMADYSAGHIVTDEARELIIALDKELGGDGVSFYPGVSYRHLCKLRGHEETLQAVCTPPHDIPGQPVAEYLPRGVGSDFLKDLMHRSEAVLAVQPVNERRRARDEAPATTIWLFWGSGRVPEMPPFRERYGLRAALTSGVDLLRGLGGMMGMDILEIAGVSDGPDNDYAAQAAGAIDALADHDLVVIHIEAPDEAAHAGSIDGKINAIERIDREVIGRLRDFRENGLRLLVMPDHPTPLASRTHTLEPVPFLLWGTGFAANGAASYSEVAAGATGLFIDPGYSIMSQLMEVTD